MRDQRCGRPSVVYDTDPRTKLTALETISRWLLLKKRKTRSLSHPLGHLGVTYALHPWLIGKPVVDFIFVVIELFSLSATVETLWAEIGRSRHFSKGWVTLSADFRGKGASPTNHCWCQSSRVIALSCGIKISAVRHLVLSQSTRVTDRQIDGRTDRITTLKTSLAYARAVKMSQRKKLSLNRFALKFAQWLPSATNHACKVSNWNFQGLQFYGRSSFRFSYWYLHGSYN